MQDVIPTAVTTFSTDYYEKYGRECLEKLVKYWPGRIVAYYEKDRPQEFQDKIEYRDLFEQRDCVNFVKWTSMVPLTQGILPRGEYHYNFNANKFGRKVYAITDFADEGVPFFFLGADTRCLKPIPVEFLKTLMDGYPGVFLLRRHIQHGIDPAYVESDFAGYDPRYEDMRKLLTAYRKTFNDGSFLWLKAWHDCGLLDELLDIHNLTPKINNLSDGVAGDGKLGLHVWPNTVLAEYMVHLKGASKKGQESA